MQDKAQSRPGTVPEASRATTGAVSAESPVLARVPQGHDSKINLRFVPARDIQLTPPRLGCQPRQGAPRRFVDPVDLPESLAGKLKNANKKFVDWLARDEANTRLFLAQPVAALAQAGVELSRSEQKALTRAHEARREASLIAPGVRLTGLSASVAPKGRVGDAKPAPKPGDTRGVGDCGCGSKGKE